MLLCLPTCGITPHFSVKGHCYQVQQPALNGSRSLHRCNKFRQSKSRQYSGGKDERQPIQTTTALTASKKRNNFSYEKKKFSSGCYSPLCVTEVEATWSNCVQKVLCFVSLAPCSYPTLAEYGNLNNTAFLEHGQIRW